MSMSKAKAENRPLPKRFYSEASAVQTDGGWGIFLDGRPVKTPDRHLLAAPCEELAVEMAAEWDAQVKHIDPFTMPLTRLAHVVTDRIEQARNAAADEISRFAGTDLLCHRSDDCELAARQAEKWDPLLDWSRNALDAPLKSAATLLPLEQPEASVEALRARAEALDSWRLTALASSVSLLGSAVLGFALLEAEIDGETAFALSRLDEDYQAERWGEDSDAVEAAANRKRDLLACERVFRLLDEADV
ncbi:MAG: Chaperone required for the assembly of the mitochondrial F1-ATPase [Oceanicaulis sp. HLUCCA04]|nr:MAG: Chaperone required for the assembly of the mitochondrial F1-ATPase [Oceanicaulis sp. HLUCCA04]